MADDLTLELVGFLGRGLDPSSGRAGREDDRELILCARVRAAEAAAASDQLRHRQSPRLLTLDERAPTRVDGAALRQQQHAQRLLPLSGARQPQRLGREPCAGGMNRVNRIVLATESPLAASVATDLEHRLAALAEVAGKTGAVVAGALNGPGASAAYLSLRETDRLA